MCRKLQISCGCMAHGPHARVPTHRRVRCWTRRKARYRPGGLTPWPGRDSHPQDDKRSFMESRERLAEKPPHLRGGIFRCRHLRCGIARKLAESVAQGHFLGLSKSVRSLFRWSWQPKGGVESARVPGACRKLAPGTGPRRQGYGPLQVENSNGDCCSLSHIYQRHAGFHAMYQIAKGPGAAD